MLFPYKDDNPRVLFPIVTYAIIGINIIIFLLQFYISGISLESYQRMIFNFGFVPNKFEILNIFSSMFMHGGFLHLIGNMWFLYIFGDNVESILGHMRFFYFYIFCGIGAALTQFIINPSSSKPY